MRAVPETPRNSAKNCGEKEKTRPFCDRVLYARVNVLVVLVVFWPPSPERLPVLPHPTPRRPILRGRIRHRTPRPRSLPLRRRILPRRGLLRIRLVLHPTGQFLLHRLSRPPLRPRILR